MNTPTCNWITIQAVCDICDKEWTATYPEGVERIECPECGHMHPVDRIDLEDDDEDLCGTY